MSNAKKIVRVQFGNTPFKTYDYLLPTGMRAEVGDLAVVNSPQEGVVTVTIKEVLARSAGQATKAVEAIVSLKVVREIRAKQEEMKLARKRLDVLLEQCNRDNKYAVLADNAEARDLMAKLGFE